MNFAGRALVLATLLCTSIGVGVRSMAQPEKTYAGWVELIQGKVQWRADGKSAPVTLDPQRDRYRRIYVGESVLVGAKSMLKLQLFQRLTVFTGPTVWFPIKAPPANAAPAGSRLAVIRQYAQIGGRDRVIPEETVQRVTHTIYAPSEGSVADPMALRICWNPDLTPEKVTLELHGPSGALIWRQANVDGRAGSLAAPAAASALTALRDLGELDPYNLRISVAGKRFDEVKFALLPREAAAALNTELARWNGESGLLRWLGRADSYSRAGMLVEAAREYDAALALAPQSRDLLTVAIDAHTRIGDSRGVAKLERRLAAH